MLGKRRSSHSLLLDNTNTTPVRPIEVSRDGVTPLWLNYGFRKLWKLVQKNSKQFAQEAIQPVIDDTEMPDFVKDVRLVQYTVGNKAPVVRDLRPVPARSLAELQCTFRANFQSTSDLTFEVDITLPKQGNSTVTIPVSLRNLEIDALMWSAFTLVPYQPYVTTWTFSSLETPKVAFDMNVASALPVTAVPGLRSLFFQIIRKEIPKDFMFPLENTVDFTPDKERAKKKEFMDMTVKEIEQLSQDEIKEYCPKEWALYNSLDLDNTGSLEQRDLERGLADWGYSTQDSTAYFNKLDQHHDGSVSFSQFCMMWPNVTTTEIGDEYEGMLSLTVGKVANMTKPVFGWSNPVVSIKVDNETVSSGLKRLGDDDIFLCNEEFLEIPCGPLDNQTLQIHVQDDSNLSMGGVGTASFPLETLKDSIQSLNIDLEPQGSIQIDLSYNKFVDRWDTCRACKDDDDDLSTSAVEEQDTSSDQESNDLETANAFSNKTHAALSLLKTKGSAIQRTLQKTRSHAIATAKSILHIR